MLVDKSFLGEVVVYRLLPKDLPVNPDKLWRGRVVSLSHTSDIALVESLEPEYYELTEFVSFNQIEGKGYDYTC